MYTVARYGQSFGLFDQKTRAFVAFGPKRKMISLQEDLVMIDSIDSTRRDSPDFMASIEAIARNLQDGD